VPLCRGMRGEVVGRDMSVVEIFLKSYVESIISLMTLRTIENKFKDIILFANQLITCLKSYQLLSYSRYSQHVMEHEDSLPCSHWSLSWTTSTQSTPPYPTFLRSILILSSHLWLGLLALPPKLYLHFYSPRSRYMPISFHTPWLDHSYYT
jgi:hypothetical protein